MILKVIRTTDHQYLGLVFDVPDPMALRGLAMPIADGIRFRIDKFEQLNDHCWRFSNPGYVALAEVVG